MKDDPVLDHLRRDTDAQLGAAKAAVEDSLRDPRLADSEERDVPHGGRMSPKQPPLPDGPNFGNTLEGIKAGLGISGAGLDTLAQELLGIINRNPTHAVVALSKHGWVLTTQDELDAERASTREKLAATKRNPANGTAKSLIESAQTILHVAADEVGTDPSPANVAAQAGFLEAVQKVLHRAAAALE
jgi:hypothetical protein